MSTPKPSLVKWVHRYGFWDSRLAREDPNGVPVIPLDSLTELAEGLRDRPKKERLESVEWDTAYLAALDDLKAQLEAYRKEGA